MDDQFKSIRDVSLRLLASREHSRVELKNKLLSRGFDSVRIEQVLDQLIDQDCLSDQRFAEAYVRYRIEKGYGPNRIAYDLHQSGIEDFDWQRLVDETGESWLDVLESVYRKKYPQDEMISLSEWSKRSRFLLSRGFTGGLIAALVKKVPIHIDPALESGNNKALKKK